MGLAAFNRLRRQKEAEAFEAQDQETLEPDKIQGDDQDDQTDEDATGGEKTLIDYTVKELIEIAKEKGIEGTGSMKKQELIDNIEALEALS